MVIGALSAVARWTDYGARAVGGGAVALIQLMHGLTYGLTQVGIMGLLVHHVPVT